MINTLNRFWRDESGPELVEWAVVTIILLIAAVVLYVAVGRALGGVVCSIFCWIQSVRSGGEIESSGLDDRDACDDETWTSCKGEGEQGGTG
jgi:Flp pilus assembly pilin Flp